MSSRPAEEKSGRSGEPGGFKLLLSDLAYGFFRACLMVIFWIFFRVRVKGLGYCPHKGGPLMIVSNHISEWDPPFLGSCLPWQVNWMAKVELFELFHGRMGGFFRMLHCVPVDRKKADLSAVKRIVHLLQGKRPVVVFAEGGVRTSDTSLLGKSPQLKDGAASMAVMAGCPILPVLINGTIAAYNLKNWFRRRTLEVVIGPVFEIHDKNRKEVTQQILMHLRNLKPQLEQQGPC